MRTFIFIFYSFPIFATFVSNPSDPFLFQDGIFFCKNNWGSFRIAYVTEYVYKASCKQEFKREGEKTQTMDTKMLNYFGVITFNILSRVDLYGIAGSLRMELDDQIYPKREPAWGLGLKILLLKTDCFDFSIDGKFLISEQKPTYFIVEQQLSPLITKLHFNFREEQLALAFSYKTPFFVPYIGITYFYCKLTPSSANGYAELPNMDFIYPFEFKTFVSRKNWGLVLGGAIYACEKAALNLEARHFDQSSVNARLEVRF